MGNKSTGVDTFRGGDSLFEKDRWVGKAYLFVSEDEEHSLS